MRVAATELIWCLPEFWQASLRVQRLTRWLEICRGSVGGSPWVYDSNSLARSSSRDHDGIFCIHIAANTIATNNFKISQVTCCQWMKAQLHNFKFLTKTDVVNGGKQHDIILKFQKSDIVNGWKQHDIILKFQNNLTERHPSWNPFKRNLKIWEFKTNPAGPHFPY